ncbi:MAG: sugar phosphate isomerase/epimerase family protein [Saprospiraceae bacterium]
MMTRYFSLLLFVLAFAACSTGEGEKTASAKTETTPATVTSTDFGGLALYTLRDTMAGEPREVLQAVKDLGYAYVEAAGYKDGMFYGMSPAEFKGYLNEVGLEGVSTHMVGTTPENIDQMVADAKAAGFTYFVIPIPPMGAFNYDNETQSMSMTQDAKTVMANINMVAEKCAAAGLKCLYHNHDFEFVAGADGIVPIKYFLENSDPAILNFQMDMFWVTKAEADPVAYFDEYPGRFHGWHVKDMDEQGRFAPVGEGTIDFARILAGKEKSGMKFYLVEQDQTFELDPMEAVKISHKGLGKFGFK